MKLLSNKLIFAGDAVVPMCQCPKVEKAVFLKQKIPGNDNLVSAHIAPDVKPAGGLGAGCQALLIFCCAIATLLI
jgi:hypothetical protein